MFQKLKKKYSITFRKYQVHIYEPGVVCYAMTRCLPFKSTCYIVYHESCNKNAIPNTAHALSLPRPMVSRIPVKCIATYELCSVINSLLVLPLRPLVQNGKHFHILYKLARAYSDTCITLFALPNVCNPIVLVSN